MDHEFDVKYKNFSDKKLKRTSSTQLFWPVIFCLIFEWGRIFFAVSNDQKSKMRRKKNSEGRPKNRQF